MRKFRLLVVAALVHSAIALYVSKPAEIRGYYPHDTALFGKIPYGDKGIWGNLYYVNHRPQACEPLPRSLLPRSLTRTIVLVERGNCPFAQKARDVAASGAAAVVVFDNEDEEYQHLLMADDNAGNVNIPAVFVSYKTGMVLKQWAESANCEPKLDPSSLSKDKATGQGYECNATEPELGQQVPVFGTMEQCDAIPGCLWNATMGPGAYRNALPCDWSGGFSKCGGSCIACDSQQRTDQVYTNLAWPVPHPDKHVEWQVWTSSSDTKATLFKADFAKMLKVMLQSGRTSFTPYLEILDGNLWSCTQPCPLTNPNCTPTNYRCGMQCTNQGRYCAVDPEEVIGTGRDGSDVVQENLRQICIYRVLQGEAPLETYKWWEYVTLVDSKCWMTDATFTDDCAQQQMRAVGIDVDAVESCVAASGGAAVDGGVNYLLEESMRNFTAENTGNVSIVYLPSMAVNNQILSGSYSLGCEPAQGRSGPSITSCSPLRAICVGFPHEGRPDWCDQDYCWPPDVLDACNVCNGDNSTCPHGTKPGNVEPAKGSDGPSSGLLIGLVAGGSLIVMIGGFLLMRRHMHEREERMKQSFRDMLSEYAPIDEVNNIVGRPKPKLRARIGQGLKRLAGKRGGTHNPVVQVADGADDEQQGEWAGGGDDGVEMNAQSSPAIGEADGGSRSQLVQSQGSPQSASV